MKEMGTECRESRVKHGKRKKEKERKYKGTVRSEQGKKKGKNNWKTNGGRERERAREREWEQTLLEGS